MRLAWLFVLPICLVARAEVYEAPDREPTPEETLILEFMNRLRADPAADAERMIPPETEWKKDGIDWKMFRSEMKALKPAPPLVFNLELLDASRKHSHYQILNGMTHVEDPGKPGFVARDFGERCKKAGYRGFASAENCYRNGGDPWRSHAGFVVDFGSGPGGMQPGRGHRMSMVGAGNHEVGPSALPHDRNICVTHNFGQRKTRCAGGVVYFDKNDNKFYDLDEGVGDVTISVNNSAGVPTWKSGAYTLEIPNSAVTLTATFQGEKFSKTFEPGKDNVKFDWIIPAKLAADRLDKLIAEVEKIKEDKVAQRFAAQIALHVGTRGLLINAELEKKAAGIVGTVGKELDAAEKDLRDQFAGMKHDTHTDFLKAAAEKRKQYKGTIAEKWFADAETAANIKLTVLRFEKTAATTKLAAQDYRGLAAQIEAAQKTMTSPFKNDLAAMAAKLKNAADTVK